jgi:hypothetical protein
MSTQQNDKIYFGYFPAPDFVNSTVLFFGDPPAFARFQELLDNLAQKQEGDISLGTHPFFVRGNVDVTLRLMPHASGMKKASDAVFEWGLSAKECRLFADALRDFAQAEPNAAFHQYLDCEALDNVEVVASVGEYSIEFFKKHGDNMWK